MKTKKLYSAHFKGISNISKMIRKQTDSIFSHTAVYLNEETKEYIKTLIGRERYIINSIDEMDLIEQWPHGNNFFDAWFDYNDFKDHTKNTEVQIWSLEMPVLEWEFCVSHYIASIKEKYDFRGVTHFKIKAIKEDPLKSFCSEIFSRPIIQVKNFKYIKPFNIYPGLAVAMLEMMGGKLEEEFIIK